MLLILLIIKLAKLTVHYNKLCLQFEIGKFMVYLFTVHCIVYSKLLLQVYKFIVHQIVYNKLLQVTSH